MHVRADFLGYGCTNRKPFGKVGEAGFWAIDWPIREMCKKVLLEGRNGYGKRSCRDTAYLCRSAVSRITP